MKTACTFPDPESWKRAMEAARSQLERRRIPADLADDALGEAATRAVSAILAGKRVEPLAGWLVKASMLVVRELNRKAGREMRVLQRYLQEVRSVPRVDAKAHLSMPGLQVLIDALIQLPEGQLKAVMLTVLRGASTSESSRDLGITPQALSEARAKALMNLRRMLERSGHSPSSMTASEDSIE